jgi:hypothetical protein
VHHPLSCTRLRPYCEAVGADSSRPAGAVGTGVAPSARRALPLGEGEKELSLRVTAAAKHTRTRASSAPQHLADWP